METPGENLEKGHSTMNIVQLTNGGFRVPAWPIKFGVLLTLLCVLGPAVPAQTFSLLHQFKSGTGGINPEAGVVLDAKGNLYGTTVNDGAFASGTVFKMSPVGKEKVLYSFTGTGGDGAFPYNGTLARDASGNLYGTTSSGGIFSQACLFGCGTVFKVDASGNETVLYRFTGTGGDTSEPWSGVVRDASGNLYGTTTFPNSGFGAIYKVDPTGTETVLYTFTGGADGSNPYGNLILDSQGNLYGTTSFGGSSFAGTVFKINPSGQETVIYNFTGSGDYPEAGLVRDAKGDLYGTTSSGVSSAGMVFKIDPTGQETVLYNFTGGADGGNPSQASLVRDSAGNLYGTTPQGGSSDFGVVFKVTPSGKETVLHSFTGSDGKIPDGTLARDKAGNLYGTTYEGGKYGGGVVFKIAP
jgi:uncharacterized repeat protein (TIGR03803 family)